MLSGEYEFQKPDNRERNKTVISLRFSNSSGAYSSSSNSSSSSSFSSFSSNIRTMGFSPLEYFSNSRVLRFGHSLFSLSIFAGFSVLVLVADLQLLCLRGTCLWGYHLRLCGRAVGTPHSQDISTSHSLCFSVRLDFYSYFFTEAAFQCPLLSSANG